MSDLVKVAFFVIAGIFLVSLLQDEGILGNNSIPDSIGGRSGYSSSQSSPASQTITSPSYSRSYDTNGDGFVDADEYRRGELDRIENEIAELEHAIAQIEAEQNRSPYYDIITLEHGNTRTSDPQREYVVIRSRAQNNTPIFITGWRLESAVSGNRATLPAGAQVLESPRQRRSNKNVFLLPGERAIVASEYPDGINTSFLTNMCTGYLSSTYTVHPGLGYSCPTLKNEPLALRTFTADFFEDDDDFDACWHEIERVPMCREYDPNLNTRIDELEECADFIDEYATYSGCVDLHKTDPNFFGDEWRLFLDRRNMWRDEREAIILRDNNGLLVDVLEYR